MKTPAPMYALVDTADANVAIPGEQMAALTLAWHLDFCEAFDAANKDQDVVVFRVLNGVVWQRIG
jgi:hypothetical protein